MTAETVLTSDDLERMEDASHEADDPLAIAARLEQAAAQRRLADPDDVGYAYLLAAEIHDRADQLAPALALVERAIPEYRQAADLDDGFPRAYRAELLFRLGQPDAAMAELTSLRDRLTTDELAASYVTDALTEMEQEQTALEWLTAALDQLAQAGTDNVPTGNVPTDDELTVIAELAIARHQLREELQLPHDHYDELADSLLDTLDGSGLGSEFGDFDEDLDDDLDEDFDDDELLGFDDEDDEDVEPVVLWWPQPEFAEVAARWPELASADGPADWEQRRSLRQEMFEAWGERGLPPLQQVTGTVAELATFLAAHDLAADAEALEAYTLHLAERGDGAPVPPGRNEPCWCGSGDKYKKCCLLRSRG